jgi:hypothetical protein
MRMQHKLKIFRMEAFNTNLIREPTMLVNYKSIRYQLLSTEQFNDIARK